jgi:hypothetical protein
MAPFESPEVVATGIKEKIDSLLVQGSIALVSMVVSIELLAMPSGPLISWEFCWKSAHLQS